MALKTRWDDFDCPCKVKNKVVLTFKSVDEILKSDHSNKNSPEVLSRGTACF